MEFRKMITIFSNIPKKFDSERRVVLEQIHIHREKMNLDINTLNINKISGS